MKSNWACNSYDTKEKPNRLSILLPEVNHFWPRPLHTTMYSQSVIIPLCFSSYGLQTNGGVQMNWFQVITLFWTVKPNKFSNKLWIIHRHSTAFMSWLSTLMTFVNVIPVDRNWHVFLSPIKAGDQSYLIWAWRLYACVKLNARFSKVPRELGNKTVQFGLLIANVRQGIERTGEGDFAQRQEGRGRRALPWHAG